MKKVFITRQIPEIGIQMLREKFYVEIYQGEGIIPRDLLLKKVKDKDAVLSLLTDKIDAEFFNHAGSNLKIVANYAVGYDNIDIEEARKRNIIVTNTPGVLNDSVAEFTLALIMTLSKRIVEADNFVRESKYEGWEPMLLLGMELKGKTLGLIGTGRIGSDVGKILHKALGMKILYNDPSQNIELETETKAKKVELNELLENSDVVSLHAPLLDSTKHLMNFEKLKRMKNSSLLINTARGPVVNETDLVKALKMKLIKGAALDVHEFEPRISKELLKMKNVILTPHIASATVEARNEMAKIAVQGIIDVLEGRGTINVVKSNS